MRRACIPAAIVFATLALTASAGSAPRTLPGLNGRVVIQATERGASQYAPSHLYLFKFNAYGYFIQLTRGTAFDANPAWSPDGQWIAFDSNRGHANVDDHDLFLIRPDASGLTQLTSGTSSDMDPTWSPDGSKIAFFSNRSGNYDIWVMNADGTGLTQLTTDSHIDWDPAWSPDGTRIAWGSYRSGNEDIWVMNADGTDQLQLTTSTARDRHASWSPDGSKIAFDSKRDGDFEIYVMNADGTGVKRLTTDTTIDARPAWSPDGRWIMFQSEEDRPGLRDLYLVRPDGGKIEAYSTGGQWATSPDWQAASTVDHCDARGTVLADDLRMFEENDVICGLAGDDRISAGAGNDTVIGGPGRDRISCGPGRDTVITDGHDVIAKDCEIRKKG